MKRHGGGARGEARGGAKARGVLRADTGGNATKGLGAINATDGPSGGTGGLTGGGNATDSPSGGTGGLTGGGNATKGLGAIDATDSPSGGTGGLTGGGNATKGLGAIDATDSPSGGTGGLTGGGKATKGLGAINVTAGRNGAAGNATAITRRKLLGSDVSTTLNPTQIDALFPHPDTSQTCNFVFKTDKVPGAAIILFRKSGRLLCMGSIVDHKHILTSKRCVNIAAPHHLLVILGCSKPWWGRRSQVKKVKKILNHEYEAALLRLKDRIVYTKFVQPARLPSGATKNTKLTWLYTGPYYVMGFAVNKHDVPGEIVSKKIYYGFQPDWYFELEFCEKIHKKFILDPKKVFCTAGGVTFCWGAWGAPVLAKVNNIMIQIGVVTGDACTSIKSGPYLAFRTDAYADWIRGHLMELHQPT